MVGLKLFSKSKLEEEIRLFKFHYGRIKTVFKRYCFFAKTSSNSTMVGLKQEKVRKLNENEISSNSTMVGLKPRHS